MRADGLDELENHASFLMLEFAAALLGEIERWMLTASPAMIDLATFADTSDKFLGPSSMFGDMQKRFPASTDEVSPVRLAWHPKQWRPLQRHSAP